MVINSGCQLNWIVGVDDQLKPPKYRKTQLAIKMIIVKPISCSTKYMRRKFANFGPL